MDDNEIEFMRNFPGAPKQPKDEQALNDAIAQLYVLKLEKIIRVMFPMWAAAMDYGEHGNSPALRSMKTGYENTGVSLRQEEIDLMLQVVNKDPKKDGTQ